MDRSRSSMAVGKGSYAIKSKTANLINLFVIKRMLVLFLALSLFQTSETVGECDFVKCFATVKSFFASLRKPGTPFVCNNLLNSAWCSEKCMYNYFPNMAKNSNVNREGFIEYCNENIANSNANWSCIADHSFRFLTCLSNASSLTTNSVRADMLYVESCRKSFEFQNCPAKVFPECGEISVSVVKELLQYILNNFFYSCKTTNKKEMLSIPVHYQLGNEYMEAANSIDYYYNFISECYDEHIRDEIDLYSFLCEKNDNLGSCISFTLSSRGKPFPAVRRLLLKYFMLGNIKCDEPEDGKKPISLQSHSLSEVKFSTKEQVSSKHSILNDETSNLFIFPESSTQSFKDSEKLKNKHLKMKTEAPVESVVEEKTEHAVSIKTGSDEKDVHYLAKNISKTSVSYSDINNFKASGAFTLHCDKTLFIVLFFLFFFC